MGNSLFSALLPYSHQTPDRFDRTSSVIAGAGTAILIKGSHSRPFMFPPRLTYRYGTDSASTLDILARKNLIWPCTADSISELSSDHNPVRFHFPRTSNFEMPPPQLNTTWSIFTNILANPDNFELPTANSTQEIDSQVSNLTNEILNARMNSLNLFYHSEQPYVQGELKELIKERNKARKTWQLSRHPQHKAELNRLQNKIKRKIYHYRQQAWEDNLSTLNAEDNSLWGIAKAFRKKSALNVPTGIALSDTNKTELTRVENFVKQLWISSYRSILLRNTCSHSPVRLAYQVFEPKEGANDQLPPLIFQHGVIASKETWGALPQILADRSKRKAYAVDTRNHGDSEWSDSITMETLSEDLLNFMKDKNIPKCAFIGHSLGGVSGLRAVLRKSGIVTRNSKIILPFAVKRESDGRYVLKADVKRILPFCCPFDDPSPGEVYEGPSYFLYGTKSPFKINEDEDHIKKHFRKAKLIPLEGAGHYIHLNFPEEFLKIVLERLLQSPNK
ncbi:uncharacterized protein TNIN_476402 [Trichonephila inaurata madagascariensis]|uniref:sn-1-specific diacylglycerol lipase ABHD11 n=1 Tax=Trichonephila inaurata madagascariensis TaxID=2747483 RepID=A0A8X6Y972_9ARAC|nr:uncharacterized protein TNIN_476402 [Trichonephila inaurata madagascariensis]